YRDLTHDSSVAKVSIIGIGMRAHPGVAQTMFRTLSEKGINIQVISTSEIKVSVLIAEEYVELAVRALHSAYELDAASRGQLMPAVASGGPGLLLRRLREIMAEKASAQTRLDKLVTVIATNMVAEVCSIYLRRAGKWLELFATEGLNPAAVHRTRMRLGEGLVGLVAETAEPVNLSD